MTTTVDALQRKFATFRRNPMGSLGKKMAKYRLYRQAYDQVALRFPVFDICRWYVNRMPRKLYALEKSNMGMSSLQGQILSELDQHGIAMTSFERLFPAANFANFQQIVEGLLQNPETTHRIEEIRKGQRSVSDAKFYLVKPLGVSPVFDARDDFLRLALSDEVLRIVCGYLGMFTRLVHLEHWCSVPMQGADSHSQRWHRDPEDKRLVKLFLYLRDVDETTGPFTYVPGTQNGGPHSRVYPQKTHESHYPPDGSVEKLFSRSQIKACTGKAGTIILCNTSGLHKGGHPTTEPRVLFTCTYTSNAFKVRSDIPYSISNPNLLREALSPAGRFAIGHLN